MEIIQAAKVGDREKLERLLQDKKPFLKIFEKEGSRRVQNVDVLGISPLHWACVNKHKDVVQLLLEHGASPNAPNDVGDTPLHWAAMAGAEEIAAMLIRKGGDASLKNRAGQTPLFVAADEATGRAIEDAWEKKQTSKEMWDTFAAEAELEKEKKKKKDKEKEDKKGQNKGLLGSLKSPFAQKTFHLTSLRRSSSPHIFGISTVATEGPCCVCGDEMGSHTKLSKCRDCGVTCHVVCATFVRDPCSTQVMMKREAASCLYLPGMVKLGEEEGQEKQGPVEKELKKSLSLPFDHEIHSEPGSPQTASARFKEQRSGSVLDEVETAMCAVEFMVQGDRIWKQAMAKTALSQSPLSASPASQQAAEADEKEGQAGQGKTEEKREEDPAGGEGEEDKEEREQKAVMEALRGGAGITNRRVSYHWPKLMQAAVTNDYEGLVALIANGEDVFVKTENGSTALMAAAAFGHLDLVELLLSQDSRGSKAGSLFSLRNALGKSALDLAYAFKREEVVRSLLSFAEENSIPLVPLSPHSDLPSPQLPPQRKLSVASDPSHFSITDVVKAISQLIVESEQGNINALISTVSETVKAVRNLLDQTAKYRDFRVAQSNQVVVHLLGDLVKQVKNNQLDTIRPLAVLLLNELKNSLLQIQTSPR